MPLAALLLAAALPAVTAPTGPWIVRADENLCLLERNYPVGDKTNTLVFQPLLDLPTMELYVVSPDRNYNQFTGDFAARIGEKGEPIIGHYYSVYVPRTKTRLTRMTLPRSALDTLADGDTLYVQAKPVNLAFKIVHPDKARTTLASCVTDLKKSWGIDPDMASRTVTPLEGNPGRYFNADSYPTEAFRQRVYGRVVALLNIGTDGTVVHCRIVSSAGTALNDGTCKVAQRIRFKPARDKDGTALPATYLLPVRWVLPGAPKF